MFYTVVTAGEN